MRTEKRVLPFRLFSFALTCAALEIASFAALHGLELIRPRLFVHGFVDSHFDSITEEFRRTFVEDGHYDRTLGWDNFPLRVYQSRNSVGQPYSATYDADGSRTDDLPKKPLLISTYGDSFTWCDEVDNDQTWQYFLETRIGYEVKNYGVGAYGTDQAILKLRGHVARANYAPITVLGIFEENINRVVTTFQPFYAETTGIKLGFKPSFRMNASGQVEMTSNPYSTATLSLRELRELAHRLAPSDFWILSLRKIDIRAPYTLGLMRAAFIIAHRKLQFWFGESSDYTTNINLWETTEGRAVMHHLVDELIDITTQSHSLPVVLFIPTGRSLRSGVPQYAKFAEEIQARHEGLHVIDLLDYEFDRERFNLRPYGGHASVYGNQVIARVLSEAYEETWRERAFAQASNPAAFE